jgi:hypothetical protein
MLLGATTTAIRQVDITSLPMTGLQNLSTQIKIGRHRIDQITLNHLPGSAAVPEPLKEPSLRSNQTTVFTACWMRLNFLQQLPHCIALRQFLHHRSMSNEQGPARRIEPRRFSGNQPGANTTPNNYQPDDCQDSTICHDEMILSCPV